MDVTTLTGFWEYFKMIRHHQREDAYDRGGELHGYSELYWEKAENSKRGVAGKRKQVVHPIIWDQRRGMSRLLQEQEQYYL